MKDNDFKTLAKEELLNGANATYKNAKMHFRSAELCADDEIFGIASSHLILGTEECIKSMLLIAGYFNVPLPFKVDKFFHSHDVKHRQAAELQPVIAELIRFTELLHSTFTKRSKTGFGIAFEFTMALALFSIDLHLGREDREVLSMFWIKDANNIKNKGFYVGRGNAKWIDPSDFTKTEYQEILNRVHPFLESLAFVPTLMPDDYMQINLTQMLNEVKINNDKKSLDTYESIESPKE